MTLPSSGALSISQIATEFGGATPHAMSEYYGAAAGIPSSGAIDISDFYGASAGPVTPSFRAVGAINSLGTGVVTAHTPTMPAAAQVGDRAFLIVFTHNSGDLAFFSDPSGWSVLGTTTQMTVWHKTVASGEPGNTVTVPCSTARTNRTSALIGVYTASSIVAGSVVTGSSASMPSVTTTGSNKRIVHAMGWDGAGSTATTVTSVTGESGGDWVIDGEGNTNSSGCGFVSDNKTTAGTISGGTAAFNNSLSSMRYVNCQLE